MKKFSIHSQTQTQNIVSNCRDAIAKSVDMVYNV